MAVDVESTARSSAPPAETSGKEHRLQPALAARRFAQKLAALTTLYALNKALAVAVADAGIHAPSALIGELCQAHNPRGYMPAAFQQGPVLHARPAVPVAQVKFALHYLAYSVPQACLASLQRWRR